MSTPSRRDLVALVVLGLCLGLVVAWVSLNLRAGNRADTLYNLHAVLDGAPFRTGGELRGDLPFYNRVLFPLLHRGLARALPFASESQCYLLLRILSFQAAFLAFALVCRRGLGAAQTATALATALLAVATVASFNFPWEEPSDALDLLVIALGVGAAVRRRFLWALGLAIVFAANRESAAFLGLIWAAVTVSRPDSSRSDWPHNDWPHNDWPHNDWPRRLVEGGAISLLSYGTAMALKTMVGPVFIANYSTPAINLGKLRDSIVAPDPLGWLAMLVALVLLFAACADWRAAGRRFLALAALFAGLALLFGLISELRVFLPTFVMLGFAVAASPQRAPG